MKVPLDWLKDFTNIDVDTHELCENMTMSGSKVEGVETTGEALRDIYIGRILSVKKHPDADKLVVCQIDVGHRHPDGSVQTVTGAPNARAGMCCPVVLPGTRLPNGMLIEKGKLRGVKSDGMACSIQELGLDPQDYPGATTYGLWELDETAVLGTSMRSFLGLGNAVIDFEITSNRPDCFSIEGLGREAAVTLNQPFRACSPTVKAMSEKSSHDFAKIDIQDPDLCARYCGRVITDVVIEPSPHWMQRRLRDAGMRPINTIVDITNYVCLELGQPMHAFDLDYLHDNHVIVRRAKAGEIVVTLDDQKRYLTQDMLVIADPKKICALAGVMGGENSEVKDDTKAILFESACFDAFSVRMAAHSNNLRTEASLRFEKGLDPENALRAMDRACELVEQLGCGKVCRDTIDVYPCKIEKRSIVFSADAINRHLGTSIFEDDMRMWLVQLGCRFEQDKNQVLCVLPTFRPDLRCMADLSEEIARFYGYNKIEPTLLSGKQTTLGGRSPSQLAVETIKDVLIAQGFFEALSYSFESPKEMDRLLIDSNDLLRHQVVIINPLGEDYSVMRSSMVPAMLRIASINASRSVKNCDIFEIAFVYRPSKEDGCLPKETKTLAAFSYDIDRPTDDSSLFFEMKGTLCEICDNLGISSLSFAATRSYPFLHPGRSAHVMLDNKPCGYIGYLHPDVARTYEVPEKLVLFSLEVSCLVDAANRTRIYRALPKFPGMTRDLAVVVDQAILASTLETSIRQHAGDMLESLDLFDVYTGKKMGAEKKSLAYRMFFRSPEKTLTDAYVQAAFDRVVKALEDEHQATLRDM